MRVLNWILLAGSLARAAGPVDFVDPRIDTVKPRWIYFASAARPFGMVALSPDTKTEGDWGAGYVYDEPFVRCFSHIHEWQLAGVPVLPVVGEVKGPPGCEANKAGFSHENEVVRAGYHKVVLQPAGIVAELTSTSRVGFHRYTFPPTEEARVLLDVGAPIAMHRMLASELKQTGPRSLAGFSTMGPTIRRPKPVTVHFVVEFDRDMASFTQEPVPHVTFRFPQGGVLRMKVALSYVDLDGARRNLRTELPGWDFDATVRESREEWNRWLSVIEVEGGTEKQRIKFYTDLWHALLGRRAFSDSDGRYIDNTGPQPKVRQVPLDAKRRPLRNTYNSDSYWGSHWTLNILWSFAYPRIMSGQISSLVDYFHNGGMIARGPAGGNYTFVMVGDQAVPLIAAAYNKGIRDFDVEAAYAGSRKNAFVGGIRDHAGYEHESNATGGGMQFYVERGYVPLGIPGKAFHREGAAQTMEYAYQDWCLSQFAAALGKKEDAALFAARAENWKKLWDAESGWIRPRTMDGSWLTPFSPICDAGNCPGFVESNAAIYTWFVPHDIAGLAGKMGGAEKAREKLLRQFELAAPMKWITPHGKHGQNWTDMENQPSCHMAHLFSHLGAPWLTQEWVLRMKEDVFGDTTPYGGYNGDEDQGQMGALGVLMGIGLFDVTGGAGIDSRYEITTPVFSRIRVRLDPRYFSGKLVTIDKQGEGRYIQRAFWNGRELRGRFWVTHAEFVKGGTLRLETGPQPNRSWGVQ